MAPITHRIAQGGCGPANHFAPLSIHLTSAPHVRTTYSTSTSPSLRPSTIPALGNHLQPPPPASPNPLALQTHVAPEPAATQPQADILGPHFPGHLPMNEAENDPSADELVVGPIQGVSPLHHSLFGLPLEH